MDNEYLNLRIVLQKQGQYANRILPLKGIFVRIQRKSILCGFLFLFFFTTKAQNHSIIPPSPISSEFAKYISHEVSLYNGIPEISIPLYTIKLKGGLTIPINLSYHASGIKFHQDDGEVGVGWVLNPGYRISRSILGYADELNTMPSDLLTTLSNHEYQVGLGSTEAKLASDRYLAGFVPGGSLQNNSPLYDGGYDQFIFSTPNSSGGFIITDRTNKTATTIEKSNLLIDYKVGQSICPSLQGITGFKVIDDVGNKYLFGEYNPQSECITETASAYYGGLVATAWGLSQITTPQGDNVEFKYIKGTPGKWTDHIRSFTVRETNPNNCFIPTYPSEPGGTYYFEQGYSTFFSTQIITPQETVIFNYDFPGISNPKRLNNIQIKFAGEILKTIEFYYVQNSYHTFLDHVTIFDSNHSAIETYGFDYYSKSTTANFTCDHYGYYLETYNPNYYFHQEFLDDPILLSEANGGDCSSINATMNNYLEGITVSREPSSTVAPDYFSLKKITYPTGGYTEYEYEPGRYAAIGTTSPVRSAGIRIKTIKSSDLINQEAIVRKYTYGDNENGYGISEFWANNLESLFVNEKAEMNYDPLVCEPGGSLQRVITYSTTMQGDIAYAFNQSGFIKYPCVTEYYSNSTPSANGKTAYYFNIGNLFTASALSSRTFVPREFYSGCNYVINYNNWDKPLLKKKIHYSLTGSQYIPLQEDVFEYEKTSSTFTGLKVEQSVNLVGYSSLNLDCYSKLDSYFNYQRYTVGVGKNILKHKIEYQYLNGGTIFSEHSYDYSNLLLSKETITKSTGESLVNYTTYPLDYNSGEPFIDDMKNNRLINYPIEKVNYLDNGISQTIISGAIIQYKPGAKGLLDSEWRLENGSSISLNSFKFSNRATGILPPSGSLQIFLRDARYSKRITYDTYNEKGNLLQATGPDGIVTSYLWDTTGNYPMAQVKGATYSQIISQDGKAANYSSLTLQNSLNELVPSAFIQTFSYKPLVGMTSQTDPKGVTTYFDYDSIGRLKLVKNDDTHILKRYTYHYKQ